MLSVEIYCKVITASLSQDVYFSAQILYNVCETQWLYVFTEPKNAKMRLAVKFFPPDPGQLQEEYTRLDLRKIDVQDIFVSFSMTV